MADEEDKEISIPQSLKDWEQIHPSSSSSPFQSSSSNSAAAAQAHDQAQAHLRGWEMVVSTDRDMEKNNNNLFDDCYIFPPSNHEGLHIPSQQQQQSDEVHAQEEEEEEEEEPTSSSSPSDPLESASQPLDSRLRVAGETLIKRLDLGFEVLWSKFIGIGSWVRSYTSGRRREVWLFSSTATGVAAAFLVSLLYLRWHQRRRRRISQQEKKDRLIFLMERTDEKLSQLLDQIAQMNEVLSAHRRVPVLRSG